jgi:predicted SpoU family rRNA methylase
MVNIKLKKLLNKINPDIVHTHGSKTSSIISSINTNRFKHVATVHGIKKNKKVYEKADFIIGVSQKTI